MQDYWHRTSSIFSTAEWLKYAVWNISDSDESDVDEVIAWLVVAGTLPGIGEEKLGDDKERVLVQSSNKKGSFSRADTHFEMMYFSPYCIYDEWDFENWFLILRAYFERVCNGLEGLGLFV